MLSFTSAGNTFKCENIPTFVGKYFCIAFRFPLQIIHWSGWICCTNAGVLIIQIYVFLEAIHSLINQYHTVGKLYEINTN